MKMKTVIKSWIIVLAFLCLCPLLKAQPGGGGIDPDPDPPAPDGSSVPFDLGISVLVAAGIGYAAKKKYDTKKQENQKNLTEK